MRYVVPVLAAIVVAIAACGDDDAPTPSPTVSSSPAPSSSASPSATLPSSTATPLPTPSAPPIERVESLDGHGLYVYDTETGQMYRTSRFLGWSSHGRLLATTGCCDGGTAFIKLDIATGTVTTVGEIEEMTSWALISPDETMVAFSRRHRGLYLVRFGEPDAEEVEAVAVPQRSWSWDSRFLAYKSSGDIVVRDVESGIERTAASKPSGILWVWSPAASVLAYASGDGLFTYDAETGAASTLVEGEAAGGPVDWSPDGTRIVAHYGETANITIAGTELLRPAVIGLDGSFVQLPVARGVHWSPDGSQLAYVEFTTGRLDDQFHVYTLSTGEDVAISSIPGKGGEALAWSPTGHTIAFADWWNAFFYDIATGTTTPILSLTPETHSSDHLHGFSWSPDGRYLTISISGAHD